MNFAVRGVAFFALLALALFMLGCTATLPDKNAFEQLAALQEKYSAKVSFPANEIMLNDYVSELSLLRGKTAGSAAKVIDAELYSAQAFYYLNKSLSTSAGIDFSTVRCSSKEIMDSVSSAALAKEYCNKAVSALGALSSDESKYLRSNQLGAVKGYGDKIVQLESFFKGKC